MKLNSQSKSLEGKKGRCKREVPTIPGPTAFLVKVKTLMLIFHANYSLLLYNPGFYRTEFNDCCRRLYEITVCFRSKTAFLNLSKSEVFLLKVNLLHYLAWLHDGKYFTVSSCRHSYISRFNNQP